MKAEFIQLGVGHIFWTLHLLPFVKISIYFLNINLDLRSLFHYLHLPKDVLYLLNVQQITAVFVSVNKGHHGLCLKRIKLIEPVKVQFGLANK